MATQKYTFRKGMQVYGPDDRLVGTIDDYRYTRGGRIWNLVLTDHSFFSITPTRFHPPVPNLHDRSGAPIELVAARA